jgi:hypothetical protein
VTASPTEKPWRNWVSGITNKVLTAAIQSWSYLTRKAAWAVPSRSRGNANVTVLPVATS